MFHVARALTPSVLASSIWLAVASLAGSSIHAQESSTSTARDNSLPNAPQPVQVSSQPGEKGSSQTDAGNISGTVLDTRGDVLQGAEVTLTGQSGSDVRTVESGNDGQFAFTSLPPDAYRITVTAPGMNRFTSTQILLHAGEFRLVPAVTLSVSGGSTSVTVTGNKEELSLEQVQIAVQQRVVGLIPNFYSTYDWNAPPMEAKEVSTELPVYHRSSFVLSGGWDCRCRAVPECFPGVWRRD
jgi:Carboxypeptidase regulatory-like domain